MKHEVVTPYAVAGHQGGRVSMTIQAPGAFEALRVARRAFASIRPLLGGERARLDEDGPILLLAPLGALRHPSR